MQVTLMSESEGFDSEWAAAIHKQIKDTLDDVIICTLADVAGDARKI